VASQYEQGKQNGRTEATIEGVHQDVQEIKGMLGTLCGPDGLCAKRGAEVSLLRDRLNGHKKWIAFVASALLIIGGGVIYLAVEGRKEAKCHVERPANAFGGVPGVRADSVR